MRLLLTVLPLVSLFACAEDVAKDKAHAEVSTPPVAPAPTAAPGPTTGAAAAPVAAGPALPIDRAHSRVHAKAAKITRSHDIDFADFTGDVRLDAESVAAIGFVVQVASLTTDPEKLTNHLKSDDFLGVGTFPTATFTSTEIRPDTTTPDTTHVVTGDLTLHGVTKRVSFPAKLDVTATEVKGHTEFSIDRRDFGVVYPGMPNDLIQDAVVLTVDLSAPRPH
jgi:polyisoprenoid-binding protein YceI